MREVTTPFVDEGTSPSGGFDASIPWTQCPFCCGRFPEDTFSHGQGDKVHKPSARMLSSYSVSLATHADPAPGLEGPEKDPRLIDTEDGGSDAPAVPVRKEKGKLKGAGGGNASAGAPKRSSETDSEGDEPVPTKEKAPLAIGPLKVIMKVFFAARFARPDLIRACTHLALYVTKWDRRCDQKLHRVMCYIKATLRWRHIGWVRDGIDDVAPHLFADADFAGCAQSSRSTSGSFLCVRGPSTFFPSRCSPKDRAACHTPHQRPSW